MTAELQPPDNPITAAEATATNTTTTAAKTTTAVIPGQKEPAGLPLAPKRQRRPSVRLGEIGDQPTYDSHIRSTKFQHHTWRRPKDTSSKSIKGRSLTNLVNGGYSHDFQDAEERNQNGDISNNNNNNLEFTHKRVKSKRATTAKRARTNWMSEIDGGADGDSREDGDETFLGREFDLDSDSPLKDQSPVHSVDNVASDFCPGQKRPGSGSGPGRARVSRSPENENNEFDNNVGPSDGVRTFLIELGLSRYSPIFEIHEVDDEVLPMLTLEDLKDMGINAVGSRRKLYTAIQKLLKRITCALRV